LIVCKEQSIEGSNDFLISLIKKMGTVFSTPEEVIISPHIDDRDIYFITTGDCTVNVYDHHRTFEHVAVRLLIEGDFFGEISYLYGCKRTSTVVSRNFNTMAKLSR
jgi:CRP-like cAMP-binding protein